MAEFAPVGIRIKARGTPANMAALNGASGARSTSGLMRKRWRFGPSKSPLAQWMRGFYPNFSTKSRRTRKSVASRLMARDFDRPVAELQVRITVLNGYTALGIPVTQAVG